MTSRLAVVAVLAVASPVSAIAASTKDPDVPFVKYSLDNGLEVILHQDRAVPLVHVDVWYHVGSGDEDPGKTGFAHLFEHMMFQGTKDTGEDRHFAILREIGGKDENGTTNTDRTNYFETVPSHQLETALWLESERMGYLLGAVTGKSLDNQKEVVRNERRQNYDNVPFGKDRFATAAMLYPEGHPLRYLTIGRHEDVDGAKLADVRSFFKKWYRPSNATLCLAGDFEMDQAKALVKKWFGSFPKLDRPEQRELDPSKEKIQTAHVELRDGLAKLRRVHFVWHSPANFAPGDAALDVASDALGPRERAVFRGAWSSRSVCAGRCGCSRGRSSGRRHST
ncbi:MAG: pitrilysin family protein [Acidobacteriota bacterium]